MNMSKTLIIQLSNMTKITDLNMSASQLIQVSHFAGTISRIFVFSVFFICFSLSSSQPSLKNGIMSLSLLAKLNFPTLSMFDC